MQREQRHFDGKAGDHRQEYPELDAEPESPSLRVLDGQALVDQLDQAGDGKGQLSLVVDVTSQDDPQKSEQGDQATGQGVDEELARRVTAFGSSPDADEEKER